MLRDHRAHATGATQRRGHEENWEFETHRRPNRHCSARHGPPCGRRRRSTACGPSTTRGCVPRCRRPDARRHATVPQSWMQRENWEFETHRLTAVFDAQHGGFATGWSPVSWRLFDELFVNLTMPSGLQASCIAVPGATLAARVPGRGFGQHLTVSYEAIRLWCLKVGSEYARRLRRRHGWATLGSWTRSSSPSRDSGTIVSGVPSITMATSSISSSSRVATIGRRRPWRTARSRARRG